MLSSRQALCTALFCLASATAPVTSHAAEWRVVSFDVDLLSLDEASSAGPLQHAKLSGTGLTFDDGAYRDDVASGLAGPATPSGWSSWRLSLSSGWGGATAPPSVDLSAMTARFDSATLTMMEFYPGDRGTWVSILLPFFYAMGLDEAVPITQIGEGQYQAAWQIHSTMSDSAHAPYMPLYAVSLRFESISTPPPVVPEPTSGFMALAGIGAVAWARCRRARRISAT